MKAVWDRLGTSHFLYNRREDILHPVLLKMATIFLALSALLALAARVSASPIDEARSIAFTYHCAWSLHIHSSIYHISFCRVRCKRHRESPFWILRLSLTLTCTITPCGLRLSRTPVSFILLPRDRACLILFLGPSAKYTCCGPILEGVGGTYV